MTDYFEYELMTQLRFERDQIAQLQKTGLQPGPFSVHELRHLTTADSAAIRSRRR